MRAGGRFGRFSFKLLQDWPPSRERNIPADPATAISSSLDGETAKSRMRSPTIDNPWNDVRFSQFLPLSPERYTNRPKAYTRGLEPAGLRTFAAFSGRLIARPSGTGGVMVSAGEAVQRSKSLVSKILPDGVRIRSWSPAGEYQTRATGPVATPASSRSMAALPTCLQSMARPMPWPLATAARASPARPRPSVALLLMERVHCTLILSAEPARN